MQRRVLTKLPALARQLEGAGCGAAAAPVARALTTSAAAAAPVHPTEEVYNRTRSLIPLGNRVPTLAPDSFVATSAVVVGDVDLYEKVRAGCRGEARAVGEQAQ